MVITRSQTLQKKQTKQVEMETFSDNEKNASFPDLYSRLHHFSEPNEENNLTQERDHERVGIEQRFMDMDSQIGELTSMGKSLTEKISSSNREGSGQNVLLIRRRVALTASLLQSTYKSTYQVETRKSSNFVINCPKLFNCLPSHSRSMTNCRRELFRTVLDRFFELPPDEPLVPRNNLKGH